MVGMLVDNPLDVSRIKGVLNELPVRDKRAFIYFVTGSKDTSQRQHMSSLR
jgi:hypothetical protein